jgi:alcohol dehydrogenase/L-iditol 2-dehydrogenase
VELRDVAVPEIGPDDVLLEVAAVGVCGSDLHMWSGTQGWKVDYPCVLGHEFAGRIAHRGANVAERWRVGERVVSETAAVVDPDSPLTRRGLYNLDPNRRGYGAAIDGAMTRFVRVPQRILHRVPDALPLEHAALSEPCCVAFNATAVNSRILPGDRVLVLGPGPIGVLCAAIARLCGAEVALAGLPRDATRLAVAEQYGCVAITGDPLEWAMSGDGLGADGVVDATGVSVAMQTALTAVRPAGWITKVGWGPEPFGGSLDPLVQKNVRLQGSFSHHWTIWERVIQLLTTGRLDVRPILGGQWPLEEWHTAFETMHSGAIVKAVLRPGSA